MVISTYYACSSPSSYLINSWAVSKVVVHMGKYLVVINYGGNDLLVIKY